MERSVSASRWFGLGNGEQSGQRMSQGRELGESELHERKHIYVLRDSLKVRKL